MDTRKACNQCTTDQSDAAEYDHLDVVDSLCRWLLVLGATAIYCLHDCPNMLHKTIQIYNLHNCK
eukprot:SAG31_NODE_803_length_12003_cov_25.248593_5_plen_65_part_00